MSYSERRRAHELRAAVDRLLEQGLVEFVILDGRRRPVATERAVGSPDLARVKVVIETLVTPEGGSAAG